YDRDVILLEQRRAEADRVGDLDAAGFLADVSADVGEAVEGALRLDAGDLWQLAQSLPHVSAALFELLAHVFDAGRAARIAHCGIRRVLSEAGDVAGHLALKLVDRIDDVLRPADVTNSPAGHREALGVTVERERLLQKLWIQRREADEL